jgi:hypothetical protein
MAHGIATNWQEDIGERLGPFGLLPLGWFELDGRPALLIGNVGSSLWPAFSLSEQIGDGQTDPLNRWTEVTISQLVDELPGDVVLETRYPFGDPNWPFQDYARRALGVHQSPIGLMIHPAYGLWTAFRAVLVFAERFEIPDSAPKSRPCDTCQDKPCLTTCPIGAFTVEAYDYLSCKSHVASSAGKPCFEGGCLARQACPVGQGYIYESSHQNFHMKAYT